MLPERVVASTAVKELSTYATSIPSRTPKRRLIIGVSVHVLNYAFKRLRHARHLLSLSETLTRLLNMNCCSNIGLVPIAGSCKNPYP